jgi:glycerol-3-phosphate acyltransferase PlsY
MLITVGAAVVGYLIGSVPPGFIMLKLFKGIDVRQVASGRTGATNAARAGGTAWGVATALADILKGALAVIAAGAIFGGMTASAEHLAWARTMGGVFAVIGHNWSLYLGFQGGAGTTPNIGWASAVWWPLFPIDFIIGALILRFQGMASVASLTVAVLLPLQLGALWIIGVLESPAYAVGAVITGLTVVWALRPNIRRLIEGNERVVGPAARRREKSR